MMLQDRSWKMWVVGVLLAAVLFFPYHVLAAGGPPIDRGQGSGVMSNTPSNGGTLDQASQLALYEALEEEYGALAVYNAVMDQFGSVPPFSAVANSEETHVAALLNLFERYGLEVPAASEVAVPTFDTLQDACDIAVQAEIADGALYERLFDVVTAPDIIRVFTNLQRASLDNHLPAFESCSDDGEALNVDYGTSRAGRDFGGISNHGAGRSSQGRGRMVQGVSKQAVSGLNY